MSSEAAPSSLILVRRSADGTVKWTPLESPAQHVAVAAADTYTLIDRANYEAPQTLVVERVGKDLVVEVHGHAALVLDGFFTAADVEFYPTTNIAAGAGPFSGPPLTADSPAVADSSTGELVLWSADQGWPAGTEAVGAGSATVVSDTQVGGGSSPLLWVGLAAGGLGLVALAGGGGGSGGGESGGSGGGGGTDTTAPQITSGAIAPTIGENSGPNQVVYTATATDASTVTYSLKAGGDADAFSINANTGAVKLTANPNFETKPSYSFTVVATDAAHNSSERAVTLAINNLDEVAPTITSGGTASPIEDHSGPNQVVYTVTSTDTADISTGNTTYSLKPVGDSAAFDIDANTGAVRLHGNPDFNKQSSYSFTVVATDAAGNHSEQAVTLAIHNVDDVAPTITSGGTASPIEENSGPNQVVYTATATDASTVTYSLKASGDADAFNINANTGAVTLTANPNFETKSSYSFTVVATDAAHNSSERAVTLAINNLDEVAPTITSGGTASPIDDHSGPNQIVYTVTSTDTADISTGNTTYSLKPVGDSGAFDINANTGAVRLHGNPDFNKQSSYSFTVVATDAAGNHSEQAVTLAIHNLDDVAPTITSGGKASPIEEDSGPNQVVYTATATDASTVTYSLSASGDAGAFSINANTGAVKLTANPNFETKPGYSFTVVATDAAHNSSERAVTLAINNLDEVAPKITSGHTASPIEENSGPNQVVYTVRSTDTADISTGNTTYSLKPVGDSGAFDINANTGAVRLNGDPDFETKSSYSFTVVATDVAGNHSERAVSLAIHNLDEVAPTITSGATASPIEEHSGPNQIVYTVTSTDTADISSGNTTYSLKAVGDSAAFDINANTGAVRLNGDPDFHTKSNYSFTVVATDAAHNSSQQAVSLHIVNINDTIPPTLSVSTPTNNARDVPVDQNIVLVFSENVRVGSGTIILMDHGDRRTIDVHDGSQVSISGDQVTINPASDLNSDGDYHVRIDAGAFTDLAGNPFAGGDTLHFRTANENNLVSAALDGGRAFQIDASPEIDIRGGTLTAATDGAALWSGSANLGSDARVMLVGNGADVSDLSARPNPMSIMEAAIAWQSEPNGIDGNLPIHSAHEASMPVAHNAVESHLDIAHLPVAMATSQGLV